MNLFELHSNPETLDHYNEQYKLPEVAYKELVRMKHHRYKPEAYEKFIPYIAKDSETAYEYARTILKGRFPEGEDAIMTDSNRAYDYAYVFLGHRWPEAEQYIKRDEQTWGAYKQMWGLDYN